MDTQTGTGPTPNAIRTAGPAQIQAIWQSCTWRPGEIREIRILNTARGTVSGIFANAASAIEAIQPYDGAHAIYVTANPLKPQMLARDNARRIETGCRITSSHQAMASRRCRRA